jgi:hypothetical protein
MTKKLIFAGSGTTSGAGWHQTDPTIEVGNCPHLWTNLCYQGIEKLNRLDLVNISQGGASNADIFQQTIKAISTFGKDIEILFCQWTVVPKYRWNVGFELWSTSESVFGNEYMFHDVNLNNGKHYSKEYIQELVDNFLEIHHPHWEIVKVIEYSNIISGLAKQLGITVFFINGACPWDNNYFIELHNVEPEAYTEFTKKHILNIDTRTDEDIFKLYALAHQHYQRAGGIDESKWINLYNSFLDNQLDNNLEPSLGGINSNKRYYNIINARLKELNFT